VFLKFTPKLYFVGFYKTIENASPSVVYISFIPKAYRYASGSTSLYYCGWRACVILALLGFDPGYRQFYIVDFSSSATAFKVLRLFLQVI